MKADPSTLHWLYRAYETKIGECVKNFPSNFNLSAASFGLFFAQHFD